MLASFVNGTPTSQVSTSDRALAFGDGLFETIAISQGQAPLWPWHWQRLQKGLARLNISVNLADIEQDFAKALAFSNTQQGPLKCKVIISRGQSESGYNIPQNIQSTRIVQLSTLGKAPNEARNNGVKLGVCAWRLAQQPNLAGLKHLNRLDQVMASQELSADCFDGLMFDSQGLLIEGTKSNVFVCDKQGNWLTPSLENAGVEGVMRQVLLDKIFPKLQIACKKATLANLAEVKHLFICNALIGIVPVVQVASQGFAISKQQLQLQQAVEPYLLWR